jgi:WD40 repeat protein
MNGTLKRTLNGQTDYVLALTVLQNGDLASGSADNTIKIWNPINGTLKRILY